MNKEEYDFHYPKLQLAGKDAVSRIYIKTLEQQNKALMDERANMQKTHRNTISSLEKQNQGLQSLLDLKQQEISVLESNIDSAIAELEYCGWYEATDKQQTMEVLYNIKEKQK